TGGKVDYVAIGRILVLLLALYILSSLFLFITQWVMSTVAQTTVSELRREAQAKIDRLPLRYLDGRPHGDLLSRVTNDVDTISNTLQQSIIQSITSAIQLVGFVIMMLTISPLLTLIVLATLPLYIAATVFVAKNSQKYFIAQQREIGALSGHIEEMYSGHAIVRAFGMERRSREKFDGINGRLRGAATSAQFVSGIMFPLMNFIGNIGYVLISVVGGLWLTKGRLSLGDIVAFIQYSRNFAQPIAQTANIANVIQSTLACAERVFEVLDEGEELADEAGASLPARIEGRVGIDSLAFRYVADKPLIESLSLDAKPGHTVAIVGPTGAGKTTLVNLLMRFYEIDGGVISVDGKDIRSMPRRALRGLFGMVLQDTWLFTGSIRDNIAYGREGASEEDVVAAAKAAHADHFIRSLPKGYDTVLDEEAGNISQGQRQLLTIARALIADPRILILDEATSSVDTRTELLIQKAMGNLMAGRTSFVIAHRLSTIRDAELILVMNSGSIVEQGSHEELLAKKGFYADLYEAQFSGPASE
ncbi:MAG TPA: ABC transporter ATP-binding protein, partial [Rectinemataceae bacterium]|nr:ABC transporter ATP-binding protein [Rectinemataceae bacterium]